MWCRSMSIAAVIPVRNRADTLARAVRSVQAQTHAVDEIIIVDDASNDDTLTAAEVLATGDSRVRILIQPERRGAGAGRNRGWRAAHLAWIAFLDSDDEWLPEKLQIQMDVLAKDEKLLACFAGFRTDWSNWIPPERVRLLDLQRMNVLGSTSSAVVRRSALELVGGFDESLPSCQDWDLWCRIRAAGDIAVIAQPLVRFHQSGEDRISRSWPAVSQGHKILFDRIMRDVEGFVRRRRVSAYHRARMSQILMDFNKPLEAIKFAVRSATLWPNGYAFVLGRESLNRCARKAVSSVFMRIRSE